ncbi:3',5'-cyclic AMP phosphodiesterase CpdA [Pseudoduganella flava]|uniref:3',5'-cyclic AMP phosphodiesterase CpdA n=1 Tax=Pseudoduganella flava TaxID=871742 RepID=A0A562PWD2_9BURK|nr:3',5'-cyclic AMP phosphodiesterase CpdA [Pseudoduganella flava]
MRLPLPRLLPLTLLSLLPALAPAAPAVPLTVFAAGDIADCRYSRPRYSDAAATAALIQSRLATAPDALVLTLGDHTYPYGRAEEFTHCYAPTWGAFRDRTRPVPGNHEYHDGSAGGYYDYFGAQAGPRGRGWYSFDAGGWHFVALNSHLDRGLHAEQLAWLRDDLARHPARCTLAWWHAPMYSSGGHPRNTKMRDVWQVLVEAGAELALAGHDHDYERFAPMDADGRVDPRGMRQFVVGTGGAILTPFRPWAPPGESRQATHHGVLRLTLREDGYDWAFLPVELGWSEFAVPPPRDSGSAQCH